MTERPKSRSTSCSSSDCRGGGPPHRPVCLGLVASLGLRAGIALSCSADGPVRRTVHSRSRGWAGRHKGVSHGRQTLRPTLTDPQRAVTIFHSERLPPSAQRPFTPSQRKDQNRNGERQEIRGSRSFPILAACWRSRLRARGKREARQSTERCAPSLNAGGGGQ